MDKPFKQELADSKLFLLIVLLICVLSVGIAFFNKKAVPEVVFVCPNDYISAEAYTEGLTKWIHEEKKRNPNMTADDIINIRFELFKKNNCTLSKWLYEDNNESGDSNK